MVCQWENGEYNYTIEKLVEILDQLHLRMDVTFRSTEMEEVIPVTSQYGAVDKVSQQPSRYVIMRKTT